MSASGQPRFPIPPSPHHFYYPSISVALPVPGLSYKWDHTVCGLLCPAPVTRAVLSGLTHILREPVLRSFLWSSNTTYG